MSDVDIAVFLADECLPSHWNVKLSLHGDLCRALRRNDVDIVILNRTRNLILLDAIIRRGLVLLDRDPDLREDFELKILHRAIDFRAQRAVMMGL